jgi:hypothetical protein
MPVANPRNRDAALDLRQQVCKVGHKRRVCERICKEREKTYNSPEQCALEGEALDAFHYRSYSSMLTQLQYMMT